jgi:hypothetical protein
MSTLHSIIIIQEGLTWRKFQITSHIANGIYTLHTGILVFINFDMPFSIKRNTNLYWVEVLRLRSSSKSPQQLVNFQYLTALGRELEFLRWLRRLTSSFVFMPLHWLRVV